MLKYEGITFWAIKNSDVSEGYYISKCGQVLSIKQNKPNILSLRSDKDGYKDVALVLKDGSRIPRRVHRLMCQTFIENPEDLPVVNHKNGIKDDNRLDNLQWSTISYNTQHGYDELGVICGRQRIVSARNILSGEKWVFESVNDACEYFGVNSASISRRVSGEIQNPTTTGVLSGIVFKYIGYANVTTIENFTNVKSE